MGDPPAEEPAITIHAIPDGAEHTEETLGITLVGGTFDGYPTYNLVGSPGAALSAGKGTTTPQVETTGRKFRH